MTPSVLLNRIQALEAQLRTVATPSASSTGSGLKLLSQPVPVFSRASGTSAVPLTQFNAGSYVPATATALLLSAYARRYSGVTGVANIWAQSGSGSQAFKLWSSNSQGTDTDTEGYRTQVWCPCANQSFSFSIDNGIELIDIELIGYWASH